mgnify:FL=1
MPSAADLWDAAIGTEGEERVQRLTKLAEALWATGETQDSLAVFAELAAQIRQTSTTSRWLAQLWLNALKLRELNDYETSNEVLEEGIAPATAVHDDRNLGLMRHIRARNMFDQELLEYAKVEFERALELHESCGEALMKARAKSELATTLESLGSNLRALTLRFEALRGFELSGEVDEVAEENQAIGTIHQKMDAHYAAISYLEDAMYGWKFLGCDAEFQETLRLLGVSLRMENRLTDAEKVLQQAIGMKSGREQQQEAALSTLELSEVLQAQGKFDEAEALRAEADALLRATGLR